MIRFYLNDQFIETDVPSGTTLLDFIRYHRDLKGTKIGCREGDCGACTVIVGELRNQQVDYKSLTSCITPLGNVSGKHVVTIEGINNDNLTPVQQSFVDCSGTQCGFCTVGFVMSMTACSLRNDVPGDPQEVVASVDGNICRCTGYKSIEKAAHEVFQLLVQKDKSKSLSWLIGKGYVPAYFESIPGLLSKIQCTPTQPGEIFMGGGTDLYVQRHHETENASLTFTSMSEDLRKISVTGNEFLIGASATVTDLMSCDELNKIVPGMKKHLLLVSSTPVRNIATIAGNLVNASPIGDLTAILLALNANIVLRSNNGSERTIELRNFYLGYKKLDKKVGEMIAFIRFTIRTGSHFNFEKVSKRQYLDIASVNTAISFSFINETLEDVHLAAGGVAPIPLYLEKTSSFLSGKKINAAVLKEAASIIQQEISPISDVRGTSEYKSLLLQRLFYAHFHELCPEVIKYEEVFA